jgi:excisionase family DNA binding protein
LVAREGGRPVLVRDSASWNNLASFLFFSDLGSRTMLDEILTLSEVAGLLKVAEKTVYTMAQKSQLPAFKVRGQWGFKRLDIDQWIEQRKAKTHKRKNKGGMA